MCKCLQKKQWVCGWGLDTGRAVSRETGICLKTTHCVSSICSGDAAYRRGVSDLQGNTSQYYTNTCRLAVRRISITSAGWFTCVFFALAACLWIAADVLLQREQYSKSARLILKLFSRYSQFDFTAFKEINANQLVSGTGLHCSSLGTKQILAAVYQVESFLSSTRLSETIQNPEAEAEKGTGDTSRTVQPWTAVWDKMLRQPNKTAFPVQSLTSACADVLLTCDILFFAEWYEEIHANYQSPN